MSKLIGLILCGGESRRMGRDKGLIQQNGKPWAAIMADKLSSFEIPTVLSVNEKQVAAYETAFPQTPLLVDKLHIHGPLNGLLTAHEYFPEKDILLLATDLIDMDDVTLHDILHEYGHSPDFDFYAYEQDGFVQSFCSIFTAKALKELNDRFTQKELKKYSLHDRFNEGKTKLIPLKNASAFNNYNSL